MLSLSYKCFIVIFFMGANDFKEIDRRVSSVCLKFTSLRNKVRSLERDNLSLRSKNLELQGKILELKQLNPFSVST